MDRIDGINRMDLMNRKNGIDVMYGMDGCFGRLNDARMGGCEN